MLHLWLAKGFCLSLRPMGMLQQSPRKEAALDQTQKTGKNPFYAQLQHTSLRIQGFREAINRFAVDVVLS